MQRGAPSGTSVPFTKVPLELPRSVTTQAPLVWYKRAWRCDTAASLICIRLALVRPTVASRLSTTNSLPFAGPARTVRTSDCASSSCQAHDTSPVKVNLHQGQLDCSAAVPPSCWGLADAVCHMSMDSSNLLGSRCMVRALYSQHPMLRWLGVVDGYPVATVYSRSQMFERWAGRLSRHVFCFALHGRP